MKIIDSSPGFLRVADAKLPDLHFEGGNFFASTQLAYRHLSCLNSLSKLVICGLDSDASNQILPHLSSIVELVLIDVTWEGMFSKFGPLTSLEKLHWEKCETGRLEYAREWSDDYCYYSPEEIEEMEQVQIEYESQLLLEATSLQDSPQLRQISGNGELIERYLEQSLYDWYYSEVSSTALGLPLEERDLAMYTRS